MVTFDWQVLALSPSVLREPTPGENRLVVWVPGQVADGYRHWQRIANVPAAEIAVEEGMCSTQATSLPARTRQGLLGKIVGLFRKPQGQTWLLPTGATAEQVGERQNGLLLVWAEDEARPLDRARIDKRWGEGWQAENLGKNLFLLRAGAPAATLPAVVAAKCAISAEAERRVEIALKEADYPAEASALIDLGIASTRTGDSGRALAALEKAVTLARQFGDRACESDAMANLGMALQAAGDPMRGLELLAKALAHAREIKDRFEEKLVLGNLALVLAATRNFSEAVTAAEHALALARDLDDRPHQADLLWYLAILHADLGHHQNAARLAQAAIDIHATLRSPHVAWLTEHLKKYGGTGAQLATSIPGGAPPGGYYTGPTAARALRPETRKTETEASCDPGVLRIAWNAVRAASQDPSPGTKRVAPEIQQKRLETCGACPHHTGMRCKLCSHFTSVKTWLAHEMCPIAKWT